MHDAKQPSELTEKVLPPLRVVRVVDDGDGDGVRLRLQLSLGAVAAVAWADSSVAVGVVVGRIHDSRVSSMWCVCV